MKVSSARNKEAVEEEEVEADLEDIWNLR